MEINNKSEITILANIRKSIECYNDRHKMARIVVVKAI